MQTPFYNKKVFFPLLAVLMLALTITSVIYAQSDDTQLRQLIPSTSGHFHHNHYSPRMESDKAGVHVYNTVVSALFENPYSARGGNFSYGFRLRVNADDSPVDFYVTSYGQWYLWTDEERHTGFGFPRGGAYDLNGLSVYLEGEYATVYLNGNQLEDMDGNDQFFLGDATTAGDVWIVNGPLVNTVRYGAITHYDLFTVLEPAKIQTKNIETAKERSLPRQSAPHGKDWQSGERGEKTPMDGRVPLNDPLAPAP